MSGPYVFAPTAFEPTPYLGWAPYAQRSPFIPPAALYPSSPYSPSSPYLRPTTPQGVHFDNAYWNPPARPRRPSWHGEIPPSTLLLAPSSPGHHRSRSFGDGYRAWDPTSSWAGTSSNIQIHPLLNGEVPRPDLFFDLASPTFSPLRFVGPGQSAIISSGELHEPATFPSIMRMRISHDAIPQWPIDIEFQYDAYSIPTTPPPIALGDVLYMIHMSLRRQITHQDWAELSLSQETAIARAYTRRCRSVPSSAQVEASHGVKRIDYLQNKHMFRGLIKVHDEDGFYCWRLITG